MKVDINSLRKVSNELDRINTEILASLNIIKKEYREHLDEILNTNASKEYEEKMQEFVNKLCSSIDNNNQYYVNKLEEIANTYNGLNNEIRNNISSGDSK